MKRKRIRIPASHKFCCSSLEMVKHHEKERAASLRIPIPPSLRNAIPYSPPDMSTPVGLNSFERVGNKTGKLVGEKHKAYGPTSVASAIILRVLFGDSIPFTKYADLLLIVRILDKLSRIATDKNAFGESPYGDITGYGILGQVKDSGDFLDEVSDTHREMLEYFGIVVRKGEKNDRRSKPNSQSQRRVHNIGKRSRRRG